MFYVYAIRSDLAGRIYIGQAENGTARIASHTDGQVRSTKKDRPWNLIPSRNSKPEQRPAGGNTN